MQTIPQPKPARTPGSTNRHIYCAIMAPSSLLKDFTHFGGPSCFQILPSFWPTGRVGNHRASRRSYLTGAGCIPAASGNLQQQSQTPHTLLQPSPIFTNHQPPFITPNNNAKSAVRSLHQHPRNSMLHALELR